MLILGRRRRKEEGEEGGEGRGSGGSRGGEGKESEGVGVVRQRRSFEEKEKGDMRER